MEHSSPFEYKLLLLSEGTGGSFEIAKDKLFFDESTSTLTANKGSLLQMESGIILAGVQEMNNLYVYLTNPPFDSQNFKKLEIPQPPKSANSLFESVSLISTSSKGEFLGLLFLNPPKIRLCHFSANKIQPIQTIEVPFSPCLSVWLPSMESILIWPLSQNSQAVLVEKLSSNVDEQEFQEPRIIYGEEIQVNCCVSLSAIQGTARGQVLIDDQKSHSICFIKL